MFLKVLLFLALFASVNSLVIEQISGPRAVGEGPHWDADRQLLYYVDIPKSKIFSFDPAKNTTTYAKIDAPSVSFIIPVRGATEQFVVGLGLDVSVITWDGTSSSVPKSHIRKLFSSPSGPWRFNDAKCDPLGRLYAGTMGHQLDDGSYETNAALYKYNSGCRKSHTQLLTGVGIGNGLAWTKDRRKFYYADSVTHNIDGFDYDASSGNISNRRVVFDLKTNKIKGIADGMTIDREENLWIAINGGGVVIHVDPRTKTLLRILHLPTRDVTSVVFAGSNLDQLIVTSAYKDMTKEQRAVDPLIGATFSVTGLGVSGFPSVSAVLGSSNKAQ